MYTHPVQGEGANQTPRGYVYKQKFPTHLFCCQHNITPDNCIVWVEDLITSNSYAIVMSLYRCHVQENISICADPDDFITRTKLEVDRHLCCIFLCLLPDPALLYISI